MNSSMRKGIFKGLSLIAIVRAIALIGMVSATSFLYYDWTIMMTGAKAGVVFHDWNDLTHNSTTINLAYNINANVTLYDDNATWGISNGNSGVRTVSLWVNSESHSSPHWLQNCTVIVWNYSGGISAQVAKWTTTSWSSVGESSAVSFSAISNTHMWNNRTYSLRLWLNATKDVTVGGTDTIALQLKTTP